MSPLTEIQYLQIETSDDETHTNKSQGVVRGGQKGLKLAFQILAKRCVFIAALKWKT